MMASKDILERLCKGTIVTYLEKYLTILLQGPKKTTKIVYKEWSLS